MIHALAKSLYLCYFDVRGFERALGSREGISEICTTFTIIESSIPLSAASKTSRVLSTKRVFFHDKNRSIQESKNQLQHHRQYRLVVVEGGKVIDCLQCIRKD